MSLELPRMSSLLRTAVLAAVLTSLLAGCDSLGPSLRNAAYSMERSRAGLVHKDVTLSDGTRIAYLEGGSGEPLVLVHGFGADKDNFTRVARWLTPHYRVIAPDLVGFGESTHLPDADYHYAAQAERVRAFVQALGLLRSSSKMRRRAAKGRTTKKPSAEAGSVLAPFHGSIDDRAVHLIAPPDPR